MKIDWRVKKKKVVCRLSCWLFSLLLFLLSIFFYFKDNKFFSLLLIIFIIFYHFLRGRQTIFYCSLDENGIVINKKKYLLENFKKFSFSKSKEPFLRLFSKNKFSLDLKIKLPKDKENREKIRQLLRQKLEEKEGEEEESMIDYLENLFGF